MCEESFSGRTARVTTGYKIAGFDEKRPARGPYPLTTGYQL